MQKCVKYVLALSFLVLIISCCVKLKSVDISFDTNTDISVTEEELLIVAAEQTFATALSDADINFSKITVCTDKSDSDSIIITKVIIYSNAPQEDIINTLDSTEQTYEVEVINE